MMQGMYWIALQMAEQQLSRVWEELWRLEQLIDAKEQECYEAKKAQMSPADICLIQDQLKWLAAAKTFWQDRLSELHAALVRPSG